MAFYGNGKRISGIRDFPAYTWAEYQALPVAQRPKVWKCTDRDYTEIPPETGSVTPESGITFSRNRIKKVGKIVNLELYSESNSNTITCSSWGSVKVATIPSDFKPSNEIVFPLLIAKLDGTWIHINVGIGSSGNVVLRDNMVGSGFTPRSININISYVLN